MNQVTASAPGKLMLFGEHAVVYGHPCIVTAVDQRMRVRVRRNGQDVFHLEAPELGLSAYSKTMVDLGKKSLPKEVQFVEILYKKFLEKYPQNEGIDVETKCDFSSKFGFGSSSAVTVAFAKALTRLYDLNLTNKALFDLCLEAVLEVQGVGSGFDLASAIWGGTIYYVPPAKVVRPIDIDAIPLVVGYTGIKADTPTLVRMVEQRLAENKEKIEGHFERIEQMVDAAEAGIKARDWKEVGRLMDENHGELRQLQVSSVELEKLTQASRVAGAYGAKLSGAGGGDCMIAVGAKEDRTRIETALEQAGGTVMKVSLNAEGARWE